MDFKVFLFFIHTKQEKMKKIKTENGLKVRFKLKEDKKSLIAGRNKLQISLNGTAIMDVVPTRQIEDSEIIILETGSNKKYKLLEKEGLELSLMDSASIENKLEDFGICYDTEVSEIKIYGEDSVEYVLLIPRLWLIKFKTENTWMNNQIWLNPVFI